MNELNSCTGQVYYSPLHGEYVLFDLETTGFGSNAEIIEIGAVHCDQDGNVLNEFSTLVKPSSYIPYDIQQLTGITNTMVKDSPSIQEALPKFLEFVGDKPLAGHNIKNFDMKHINRACYKLGLPACNNNLIDSLLWAKRLLHRNKDVSVDYLVNEFDIPKRDAHRALNDAYMENDLYLKLCDIYNKQQALDSQTTLPYQKEVVQGTQVGLNLFNNAFEENPKTVAKSINNQQEGKIFSSYSNSKGSFKVASYKPSLKPKEHQEQKSLFFNENKHYLLAVVSNNNITIEVHGYFSNLNSMLATLNDRNNSPLGTKSFEWKKLDNSWAIIVRAPIQKNFERFKTVAKNMNLPLEIKNNENVMER